MTEDWPGQLIIVAVVALAVYAFVTAPEAHSTELLVGALLGAFPGHLLLGRLRK